MQKLKSNYTIRTFMEELQQSARRLRKSLKGHRTQLRGSLQTAQSIIARFLENKKLRSQFIGAVKEEGQKKGRKPSKQFNLSLEVVAKATGASTGAARKLASKRAGVLDHLRERGVRVNDTAAMIKKEGLEKLYSEWCKKKREAKAATEESNGRHSPPVLKSEVTRNDREVILPLWMKLSDRDQLLEQKLGTILTVLVSRVSEDEGDFRVKSVLAVDHASEDWAD